ncbi:MAG TPA: hypothetical protein VFK20_08110 [Vicinamibacterales bacterium]|nr:hypothetical protein [Vicinamibacterales bacterium]
MTPSLGWFETTMVLAVTVAMLSVVIWPAGRICRRIGFSPWLGVLAVIPIANVLLLWFVAVSPWPVRGDNAII